MKLSWIFGLITVLLLSAICLLWFIPAEVPHTFVYLTQGIVILSLVLLIVFYINVIKPIHAISNGAALMKGQDFSSRLAHVHQPEADRIVDMFNSMMKSLKEQRLQVRERNHLLDLLIEISPMGIIMVHPDSLKITSANAAACKFLQCEKPQGKSIGEIDSVLAHQLEKLQPDLPNTVTMPNALVYRCTLLSFMDQGMRHPFYLIESLTEDVRKAERQSYEKIIRIIAHEINNSMTGVDSILSTLSDPSVCNNSAETELLEVCSQRCRSLSKFITGYANVVKIPEPCLRSTNLCDFIAGIRVMLDSMCTSRECTLTINCTQAEIYAMIDTVLMEQVMINIVKNSIESIGRGGNVTISIDDNPASITVIDNGAGIAPEDAKNIFTPFFSTKDNGQGIGLMFIAEALRKHNATFELRTHQDALTRFTINFPKI